jgi:sulfite reductase (NADPH) hemoprotein beta-component
MSAVEDPRTLGRTRLSFASAAEVAEFAATLERFEKGEISPDEWRAFRLVRGVYGQRQEGDWQMVRVKIPQGVLDAAQLNALADVAERYSRGWGHFTTRQNLQFHFVRRAEVEAVLQRVNEAGLTTHEACGNTVRNITACPLAGVAADEAFDVSPYAEALTRHLLRHPLSASLPRKFKIGFEGCADDHVFTAINDIGWRAIVRDGRRGFRVTVGGGTSTLATSGSVLFDFLPAGEILAVAEAIVRLYHRRGDFAHKQRNRLKFLIRELGFPAWREELLATHAEIRVEGAPSLPFAPEAPPVEEPPSHPRPDPPSVATCRARAAAAELRGPGIVPDSRPAEAPSLGRWLATNVRPQRQDGYAVVTVALPLGDVTGAQLRILADLALAFGDGTVRTTHDQDLVLRWIRSSQAPALYERLDAAGLSRTEAGTVADVTSCPGAESCRLAVTQSRGLGRLVESSLRERPDQVAATPGLRIKISGCPNGCGQHHVAGLGFQGSVRRLGDRVLPQYFVMVGGGVDADGAHFARLAAKVPARRVPAAVERLIDLYRAEGAPGETAPAFFRRLRVERARELLQDLERVTAEDTLPADYVDLGDEEAFRLEIMDGECSA